MGPRVVSQWSTRHPSVGAISETVNDWDRHRLFHRIAFNSLFIFINPLETLSTLTSL